MQKMPGVSENIRKVAVVMENLKEQAQFISLDQSKPLAAVIKDLCDVWKLSGPDDYSLQFYEDNRQCFITERNRFDIQNGKVLRLTFSPEKTAQEILDKLVKGPVNEKAQALKALSELSLDSTFAQEFINKQGLQLLISLIEGQTYAGEHLAYVLKTFVELMDHGIVSWDVLEPKFIKRVSVPVNMPSTVADVTILQSCLEILESIVLHSTVRYEKVEQEVTAVNLIQHLTSTNGDIQKNAISLINALFLRADGNKRRRIAESLQTKSIRNVILSNVIRGPAGVGSEMAHQLYVLQSLMFGLLDDRCSTRLDPNDPTVLRDIAELRRVAFDVDTEAASPMNKKQSVRNEHKKLGFQTVASPGEDLRQTPPGALALDNMYYFAKTHGENFTKIVLENSCRADEYDLPFAQASIELTKMICEILKVGEPPADECHSYHPMFFTHDKPFEEFYCVCIQLLNKTWKEMRATAADLTKVLSVVREQITRSLESQPANFDLFRNNLSHLTYAEITNIWQQERLQKEELDSQSKPIMELREKLKPEILELIKQQRLNCLVEGATFNKYSQRWAKVKGVFWHCRLSPNHKVFHYGNCEENGMPSIEQLQHKLAVVDIKQLMTGKDCPQIKERKTKQPTALALSIVSEADVGESLNFYAPTERDYHIWTDGINALLGNPMTSELTQEDLDTLLSMEIKLQLLDTEGITIPDSPPPIPQSPPNYDFVYNI